MSPVVLSSVDSALVGFLLNPWGTVWSGVASAVSWGARWLVLVGPAVVLALVGAGWGLHRWRSVCRRAWHETAQVVTIESPPTVEAHGAQSVWATVTELVARPAWKRVLFGAPAVAWEYVFTAEAVQIRLWVPGTVDVADVQRAVEAAWPGAHTRVEDNTPPVSPSAPRGRRVLARGGSLRLVRPEALPITTEIDHTDPLRAVLAAADSLAAGEQACLQILARPATPRRRARAQATRSPATMGGGNRATSWGLLAVRSLLDLLTPGMSPGSSSTHSGPALGDSRVRKEAHQQDSAMIEKSRGHQCETVLRYAVTTTVPAEPSLEQWQAARATLRTRAHTFASSVAGYRGQNYYRRHRLARPLTTLGRRWLGRGDLLSLPELAALAHLPEEATPKLARAGAKALNPPPGVATPDAAVKPLGNSDAGHDQPVGVRVADARHHLHVLGATGVGKSTLLAQMILADVRQHRGTVVIDPKGDLVTDLLARLPREAGQRVVVFDPDQAGPVPCLNPLDTGGDQDLAVDNLVSIFHRIYAAYWGPRTEDVFRSACLTLRARRGVVPTLAEVPRLLDDAAFRERVLHGLSDPQLRSFWAQYEALSESTRTAAIAPLMNKLRAFLLRPFVRQALAGGASTVDMGQILDGGICLVRIPKGRLGEDTTRLIGSLVVASVWQAATARAGTAPHQRHDASMVLDECQNFLNLPYPLEDMLAESRGYRLSLTLAHQHLGQLGRDVREGIATNARNKIFFTAGPDDARELSRHTAPHLSEHDLAHLGAYHAAARLVLRGHEAPPFTLSTEPLPPAVRGRTRHIRTHAARALTDHSGHTPPATRPTDNTTGCDEESTVEDRRSLSPTGGSGDEPGEIVLDPAPCGTDPASADGEGPGCEPGEIVLDPDPCDTDPASADSEGPGCEPDEIIVDPDSDAAEPGDSSDDPPAQPGDPRLSDPG